MNRIARRDLARLAGVSQSTITELTYPGAALADAVVGRGLDLDHPAITAWLAKRHAATTARATAPKQGRGKPTATGPAAATVDASHADGWQRLTLDEVASAPLEELLHRFGLLDELKSWLDAAKKAADTRAVDLRNLESTGKVIDRELVRVHVFGAMEASHVRLLGDAPKSITRRVYAMAKANEPIEQAEKVVRDMISSHLKPAIAAARKAVPK